MNSDGYFLVQDIFNWLFDATLMVFSSLECTIRSYSLNAARLHHKLSLKRMGVWWFFPLTLQMFNSVSHNLVLVNPASKYTFFVEGIMGICTACQIRFSLWIQRSWTSLPWLPPAVITQLLSSISKLRKYAVLLRITYLPVPV